MPICSQNIGRLQKLVEELDVNERRSLSIFLSHKNDPLRVLPLEVVIQVFEYLPILDNWKLQLVCKQWRFILSSDNVVKPALERWDTHNPSDGARSAKALSAKAKIRDAHAMRLGKSFTSSIFLARHRRREETVRSQTDRSFALKAHRIAYINDDPQGAPGAVVRDLISGKNATYHTTAKESISSIALTSKILAFLNFQGKLYVQNLTNPDAELKALQLPSSSYTAFAADDNFCAVVFQSIISSKHNEYILALYDHNCGQMKELVLPCPRVHGKEEQQCRSPVVVLLNAQERTIDLFSSRFLGVAEQTEDVHVEHRRYSFAGKELLSSYYQRQNVTHTQPQTFLLADLHPTGDRGMYIFRTFTMCSIKADNPDHAFEFVLCFNSRKGRLEERYFTGEEIKIRVENEGLAEEQPSDFTVWKDINIRAIDTRLYFRTAEEEVQALLTSDESRYTAYENFTTRNRHFLSSSGGPLFTSTDHSVFVNDTFVVAVANTPRMRGSERRIHVLCFNEALRCEGFQATGYW